MAESKQDPIGRLQSSVRGFFLFVAKLTAIMDPSCPLLSKILKQAMTFHVSGNLPSK